MRIRVIQNRTIEILEQEKIFYGIHYRYKNIGIESNANPNWLFSGVFCIRGSNTDRDRDWVYVGTNQLPTVIKALEKLHQSVGMPFTICF